MCERSVCMQFFPNYRITLTAYIGKWLLKLILLLQADDGMRPIRVYLTIIPNLHSGFLVEVTISLRITGGGYSVCERSVCMLSGTSPRDKMTQT